MQFQADRSTGAWYRTVLETLRLAHSPAALRKFGVTVAERSAAPPPDAELPAWVMEDKKTLAEFWELLLELASARAWSQVQFTICQPCSFVSALHRDTALADRSLQEHRRVWEAVLKAERAVAGHLPPRKKEALTALLHNLAWNRLQLAREVFLVGTEGGWSSRDAQIREQAAVMAKGPTTTKFDLEDLFAHLVHVGRSSNSNTPMNKQLAHHKYHVLMRGNPEP